MIIRGARPDALRRRRGVNEVPGEETNSLERRPGLGVMSVTLRASFSSHYKETTLFSWGNYSPIRDNYAKDICLFEAHHQPLFFNI